MSEISISFCGGDKHLTKAKGSSNVADQKVRKAINLDYFGKASMKKEWKKYEKKDLPTIKKREKNRKKEIKLNKMRKKIKLTQVAYNCDSWFKGFQVRKQKKEVYFEQFSEESLKK
jgi:hypothetical protein